MTTPKKQTEQLTGADIVVKTLEQQGVKWVFGIPGACKQHRQQQHPAGCLRGGKLFYERKIQPLYRLPHFMTHAELLWPNLG
jgi:hypothetical protein